mmetsp:Transcript_15684/g.39866  ORF Transcript_15684/g.39866 Transcript_15684/m.39866 type:complete len:220 (+) Transcript_15684:961-1620(+)
MAADCKRLLCCTCDSIHCIRWSCSIVSVVSSLCDPSSSSSSSKGGTGLTGGTDVEILGKCVQGPSIGSSLGGSSSAREGPLVMPLLLWRSKACEREGNSSLSLSPRCAVVDTKTWPSLSPSRCAVVGGTVRHPAVLLSSWCTTIGTGTCMGSGIGRGTRSSESRWSRTAMCDMGGRSSVLIATLCVQEGLRAQIRLLLLCKEAESDKRLLASICVAVDE